MPPVLRDGQFSVRIRSERSSWRTEPITRSRNAQASVCLPFANRMPNRGCTCCSLRTTGWCLAEPPYAMPWSMPQVRQVRRLDPGAGTVWETDSAEPRAITTAPDTSTPCRTPTWAPDRRLVRSGEPNTSWASSRSDPGAAGSSNVMSPPPAPGARSLPSPGIAPTSTAAPWGAIRRQGVAAGSGGTGVPTVVGPKGRVSFSLVSRPAPISSPRRRDDRRDACPTD